MRCADDYVALPETASDAASQDADLRMDGEIFTFFWHQKCWCWLITDGDASMTAMVPSKDLMLWLELDLVVGSAGRREVQ